MKNPPQIIIDGDKIAGCHPWLFTIAYCVAVGCLCGAVKSMTGWGPSATTVIAVAALHMAVEARFGGKA